MASSMLLAEKKTSASTEADVDEALNSMKHSCANDPDFAVICDFLQKFSKDLGLDFPNFKQLLDWFTKTSEVSPKLRDMQIKLLRKTRKTVHEKSWESALSKFCFTYSAQDAWEIERFGYKNSSVKVKLRVLRELLECQFERNSKFRAKILTLSADSLRSQPIGRDRLGHAYWVTQDNDCNLRIYQEHLDEEMWQVVATNREEFVNLIKRLRGSEVVLPSSDIGIVDEDTCSSSGTSQTCSESLPKPPPPEEQDDPQKDEQKVPKLSIKLLNERNSKDDTTKDVGKGEEELAAEEDGKLMKKSDKSSEPSESDEGEFEEVEEEYDNESDEDDIDDDNDEVLEKYEKINTRLKVQMERKPLNDSKKVKPLLISQNKIVNVATAPTNAHKKRTFNKADSRSPTRADNQHIDSVKKSRPSLLDSKRLKPLGKYEESKNGGEEEYEENAAEDDVEEEMEEEDIDSVAAEEDENEEKQIEDFDDDDDENGVGEETTDPVVHVVGEGSGKECDVGNSWFYFEDELDDGLNENIVGEIIVEDIFYVRGEGYGKGCQVGNNKNETDNSNNITKTPTDTELDSPLASKISESKLSVDFGKPECLKLSTSKKHVSKVDGETPNITKTVKQDTENTVSVEESRNEGETEENKNTETGVINGKNNEKVEKLLVPTSSADIHQLPQSSIINKASLPVNEKLKKIQEITIEPENLSTSKPSAKDLTIIERESITCDTSKKVQATKMSVLESLKKELRESKQKSMKKSTISIAEANKTKHSNPTCLNRKRRLDDLTAQQAISIKPSNSESEIDINTENLDEFPNERDPDIDEADVGGKRLKMRPKQSNSELRKKVEAQKVAANEETTSSSGGEEESRRRRKIIFPKKHADQTLLKSEKIDQESTKKNTNGEKLEELPSKNDGKASSCNITTAQKLPIRNTTCKNKPTLDEIIEKKLKKTPEKNSDESLSVSSNDKTDVDSSRKCILPPPNKSPITKPLKKTLLSQIRQEGNNDAVPRKRSTSEDSISPVLSELKSSEKNEPLIDSTSTNDINSQNTTQERQRKRRSSEEIVENDDAEEPDAKKEVICANPKKEGSETNNTNYVKEDIEVDKKENIVKKDLNPEILKATAGRRSGRRGGLSTSVFVESPHPKRTRGCIKNSTKKNIQEVEEDKSEIREENKICNKSKDKEKNEEHKDSNDKSASEEGNSQKETNITELKKNQTPKTEATTKSPLKGVRKQRDVDATNIIQVTDNETPVRQSRRIAQQKIREEAERRKLEEIALRTMKKELKKKKKAEKEADPTVIPPTESSSESEESDVETKRKVQKKKCPGKNGSWSSGSEEQDEPDEVDEEPHRYETDPGSPLFKSDHEFSPESEIEDESQVVPMKRARTVRKEDAADDELDGEKEDCQKCNKSDHPEWILLCDNCDKGYHCSCLSPVLFYIPEGHWYCPPCQQEQLIKALECQLKEFDDLVDNKRKEEEKEMLRLAEEEKARKEEEMRKTKKNNSRNRTKRKNDNFSDEGSPRSGHENDEEETGKSSEESVNIVSAKNKTNRSKSSRINDKRNHRDRRQNVRNIRNRIQKSESDSDSVSQHKSKRTTKSNSSSSSSSSSYSESDNEPIYKLRKRRQINVSYRLNEYDDLINSALKKEMDEAAGAGNLGRGKDISTIIEADKEEKARQKQLDDGEPSTVEITKTKEENGEPIGDNTAVKTETVEESKERRENVGEDSDDEPINQKFNVKPSLKKKSRKLTTLDISSGDDDGSDEDFKGSSLDDEDEEDTSISASNSDSSLEIYRRHGKSKKKRRKAARRAFRQRRKDRKFVVDESDDEEVQRPKSKKKRKDDSDYTESEADDDDLSDLSENIDSADLCDDTTTDESDGAWRPNNRKKAKKSSIPFVQKSPKPKKPENKKSKKVEYSDDDISETEEEDDENDDCVGGGKGMGGKQPRSQPLKSTASKTKGKGKDGATSIKTKKKKKSSEDEASKSDSADSTRRTRGRRYAYMEDFDDDSSDGGIKPGVQRPDTPPEEREKFIKRQEEIKRMLAEKNAEGAKLAATPRLTPIKTDSEKDKRSPVKAGCDSLSTVPLSVIRQAKVLDIDYLQRRGENLEDLSSEVGEVDDDFDDVDLPNDLPEDMDEDTIARMVEEEEEFGAAAARDLPAPDEVLRTPVSVKPKIKDIVEKPQILTTNVTPFPAHVPQIPVTLPSSGLQEPVRKRLPMPTMHPPLLRHQFFFQDSMASAQHLMQRHSGPPTSHLLQSALSAPLTQPIERNYPPSLPPPSHHSLINRMTTHNIPLQPTVSQAIGAARPPFSNNSKTTDQIANLTHEKSTNIRPEGETKPRGRRKKITPLRDPLQKQQAAAAVTAATATNSVLASASAKTKETVSVSLPSSVIKSGPPMKVQMQTNIITNMPPSTHSISSRPPFGGIYARSDGPRFYDPLLNRPVVHRQRGPPQMPPSLLPPHPAIRSSYGTPPPLKGSNSSTTSNAPGGTIRTPIHHVPTYVGVPPNARHSAPHLNLYSRPSMYGNPNFGPRVNLRHPNIHASEYPTGSRTYAAYGFYPPPPPLTAPGHGPPSAQIHQAKPSTTSVIVSATATAPSTSAGISSGPSVHPPPALSESSSKSGTVTHVVPTKACPSKSASPSRLLSQGNKIMAEPRKKLTTLQSYTTESNNKKLPQTGEPSESHSSPRHQTEVVEDLSSTPGVSENVSTVDQNKSEGHASEFSGLVSYFSSQHDDYNT